MKRVLCLMVCLVMLVGMIPAQVSAEEQTFDRYGYAHLENDRQRYVYEMLVPCIASHGESVDLDVDKQVKAEDAETAIEMVIRDYPEFFWICKADLELTQDPQTEDAFVRVIIPEYRLDGNIVNDPSVIDQAYDAFNTRLDAIVAPLLVRMNAEVVTDAEKALYLHDALAETVVYEYGSNNQTAYGALVDGKAVCAGYARAYQCLLKRVGIDSWFVTGVSNGQPHAWNLVNLYIGSNPECYFTDVTWDDQGDKLFHMYLNCPRDEFEDSHEPDAFSSKFLPYCFDHYGHDYFSRNEYAGSGVYQNMTDDTTASQAANNFSPMTVKNGVGSRSLEIYYVGSSFENWLQSNIDELGKELGFSGVVTSSYANLDKEYQLTISGTPQIPLVEVSQIHLDMMMLDFTEKGQTYQLNVSFEPENATDQTVIFTSQNISVATVDEHTGLVTAVGAGTTTITATTTSGKTASCAVYVTISQRLGYSIAVENGIALLFDGTPIEKATAGTNIIIRADEAPEGMEFDHWSVKIGSDVVLSDPGKAETSFVMPTQGAVILAANYRPKTVYVTGVTLDVTEITLPTVGATGKLTASIQPADATVQKLVWASNNPGVVTVNDGELVAIAPGTAEVTVTTQDGGFVATCIVTVATHVHDETLQAVEEKKPTCTENGYGAHYVCASCGLWFEDAEGKNPLVDHNKILLKALGHTPSQWHSDESQHWQTCTVEGCGAEIKDSRKAHVDADKNGACDTCNAAVKVEDPTDPTDATTPSTGTQPGSEPTEPPATEPGQKDEQPTGSWIIWLVGSVILAGGAVAAWFFLRKKK